MNFKSIDLFTKTLLVPNVLDVEQYFTTGDGGSCVAHAPSIHTQRDICQCLKTFLVVTI